MLHYTLPNFYREIMTYFNESKAKSKTQNVWRNMNFTLKNKSLFYKLDEKWNSIGRRRIQ